MDAIIATSNPPELLKIADELANILSAGGRGVRQITGEEVSHAGLRGALAAAPFDVVWTLWHAGNKGFMLDNGEMLPALQLGQWLGMADACDVVLEACFSAQHVVTIQRAAPGCGAAANVAPEGVEMGEAWATVLYLARALVECGDMQEACRKAGAQGATQFRYFPAGGSSHRLAARTDGGELARKVDDLVVALTGNLSGQRGLIARMDELSGDLKHYAATNEEWKREHEERLQAVERRRGLFGIPFWILG